MMNISRIEIYRLSIPIEPFVIATGTMDYAQNTYIRIYTEGGLHGGGECSAFPMIVGETQETCIQVAKDFAAVWKGKDALDIVRRMAELDSYIAGNATIKSAFNIALYDLVAKHAKQPLYTYLGGQYRKIVTDITVGIGTPEEMAEKAKAFVASGAAFLKVKVGKTAAADIERIKTIRRAIGQEVPIRLDANQGWSFEDSVEVLKALEGDNIQYCEQPMRTYNDHLLPQLRQSTTIPIMADESVYSHHDADRLCRNDACDYINIKFAKSGGITEALKIQEVAAQYGIPCMIGGMLESRLALTASFHFALAASNVQFHDMDTCLVGHLEDPVTGGIRYDGYTISLPQDVIGIGADIDEIYLTRCDSWVI